MAWDVFEEIKAHVAKFRRLPTARLISGLFVTGFFACLMFATLQEKNISGGSGVVDLVAVFLWAGSCSASLVFAWTMYRATRTQKVELPNNTWVWLMFFLLTVICGLLECSVILFGFKLTSIQQDVVTLGFLSFELALTAWCILRLKAVPSHGTAASENVSL
jgi:tellurite resistance protein TehA-like permease